MSNLNKIYSGKMHHHRSQISFSISATGLNALDIRDQLARCGIDVNVLNPNTLTANVENPSQQQLQCMREFILPLEQQFLPFRFPGFEQPRLSGFGFTQPTMPRELGEPQVEEIQEEPYLALAPPQSYYSAPAQRFSAPPAQSYYSAPPPAQRFSAPPTQTYYSSPQYSYPPSLSYPALNLSPPPVLQSRPY